MRARAPNGVSVKSVSIVIIMSARAPKGIRDKCASTVITLKDITDFYIVFSGMLP